MVEFSQYLFVTDVVGIGETGQFLLTLDEYFELGLAARPFVGPDGGGV